MAVVNRPYREKVVTFGEGGGLVGVITTPAEARPQGPHVVLINSGIVHRVGASRLYVGFARAFAAAGLTTLRFDLSGIGDSERASGAVSLQESVQADIAAAVDLLGTRHGAGRVVLVGLCSGAFDAFEYVLRDPRVAGAAMLDMPGPFRNWSHLVHYLAARVLRPSSWRNPIKKVRGMGLAVAALAQSDRASGEAVRMPGVRGQRSRQRMAAELDALLARGVKLSFVFTGGAVESYNHQSQFRRRFPRAGSNSGVNVELLAWCDHVFSTRKMRARITSLVRDWILTLAGPAPGASRP
jgi:pimeloyl-ACP methyl ester carboxylesterase